MLPTLSFLSSPSSLHYDGRRALLLEKLLAMSASVLMLIVPRSLSIAQRYLLFTRWNSLPTGGGRSLGVEKSLDMNQPLTRKILLKSSAHLILSSRQLPKKPGSDTSIPATVPCRSCISSPPTSRGQQKAR